MRLDLSYDGSGFHGWATQPGLRTVQETVEETIQTVLRLEERPQLTVAGRTDTGVHARGQVAHIDLDDVDPEHLQHRLRRALPDDVVMRSASEAPEGFDARFSAIERRYVYRLTDGPPDPLTRNSVVAWRKPLDVDAMNDSARHLLGEHDFASFCKKREGATTIRTLLELHATRLDDRIETTVRADAFCHSMVRALMGALTAAGEGRHSPELSAELLAAKVRDPRVTVMPAHGLTLEEVVYPPDTDLARRASEARQRRDV